MHGADYNPFQTWQPGNPEHWPPEVSERVARVIKRAEQVFGNAIDAGVWMSQFCARIRGQGQIRDKIKSADGAADALEELDRLAPEIIPQPPPKCLIRPMRRR